MARIAGGESGEIDAGQYDRIEEVLWPDGCAAMYRREMLDEVGGLTKTFLHTRMTPNWVCAPESHGWKLHLHSRRGGSAIIAAPRWACDPAAGWSLSKGIACCWPSNFSPWSLLWLNGAYYVTRLAASLWQAARNRGEVGQYRGVRGKVQAALALLKGDLQALKLIRGCCGSAAA